jgi:hypothetical protein
MRPSSSGRPRSNHNNNNNKKNYDDYEQVIEIVNEEDDFTEATYETLEVIEVPANVDPNEYIKQLRDKNNINNNNNNHTSSTNQPLTTLEDMKRHLEALKLRKEIMEIEAKLKQQQTLSKHLLKHQQQKPSKPQATMSIPKPMETRLAGSDSSKPNTSLLLEQTPVASNRKMATTAPVQPNAEKEPAVTATTAGKATFLSRGSIQRKSAQLADRLLLHHRPRTKQSMATATTKTAAATTATSEPITSTAPQPTTSRRNSSSARGSGGRGGGGRSAASGRGRTSRSAATATTSGEKHASETLTTASTMEKVIRRAPTTKSTGAQQALPRSTATAARPSSGRGTNGAARMGLRAPTTSTTSGLQPSSPDDYVPSMKERAMLLSQQIKVGKPTSSTVLSVSSQPSKPKRAVEETAAASSSVKPTRSRLPPRKPTIQERAKEMQQYAGARIHHSHTGEQQQHQQQQQQRRHESDASTDVTSNHAPPLSFSSLTMEERRQLLTSKGGRFRSPESDIVSDVRHNAAKRWRPPMSNETSQATATAVMTGTEESRRWKPPPKVIDDPLASPRQPTEFARFTPEEKRWKPPPKEEQLRVSPMRPGSVGSVFVNFASIQYDNQETTDLPTAPMTPGLSYAPSSEDHESSSESSSSSSSVPLTDRYTSMKSAATEIDELVESSSVSQSSETSSNSAESSESGGNRAVSKTSTKEGNEKKTSISEGSHEQVDSQNRSDTREPDISQEILQRSDPFSDASGNESDSSPQDADEARGDVFQQIMHESATFDSGDESVAAENASHISGEPNSMHLPAQKPQDEKTESSDASCPAPERSSRVRRVHGDSSKSSNSMSDETTESDDDGSDRATTSKQNVAVQNLSMEHFVGSDNELTAELEALLRDETLDSIDESAISSAVALAFGTPAENVFIADSRSIEEPVRDDVKVTLSNLVEVTGGNESDQSLEKNDNRDLQEADGTEDAVSNESSSEPRTQTEGSDADIVTESQTVALSVLSRVGVMFDLTPSPSLQVDSETNNTEIQDSQPVEQDTLSDHDSLDSDDELAINAAIALAGGKNDDRDPSDSKQQQLATDVKRPKSGWISNLLRPVIRGLHEQASAETIASEVAQVPCDAIATSLEEGNGGKKLLKYMSELNDGSPPGFEIAVANESPSRLQVLRERRDLQKDALQESLQHIQLEHVPKSQPALPAITERQSSMALAVLTYLNHMGLDKTAVRFQKEWADHFGSLAEYPTVPGRLSWKPLLTTKMDDSASSEIETDSVEDEVLELPVKVANRRRDKSGEVGRSTATSKDDDRVSSERPCEQSPADDQAVTYNDELPSAADSVLPIKTYTHDEADSTKNIDTSPTKTQIGPIHASPKTQSSVLSTDNASAKIPNIGLAKEPDSQGYLYDADGNPYIFDEERSKVFVDDDGEPAYYMDETGRKVYYDSDDEKDGPSVLKRKKMRATNDLDKKKEHDSDESDSGSESDKESETADDDAENDDAHDPSSEAEEESSSSYTTDDDESEDETESSDEESDSEDEQQHAAESKLASAYAKEESMIAKKRDGSELREGFASDDASSSLKEPPERGVGRTVSFDDSHIQSIIPTARYDVEEKTDLFYDHDDIKRFKAEEESRKQRKAQKKLTQVLNSTIGAATEGMDSFWTKK